MNNEAGQEAATLAAGIGTELLCPIEADTVEALNVALRGGARFVEGRMPAEIVRSALRSSIFAIQNDPRGRGDLVQRFLRYGPLWQMEHELPEGVRGKRLSADETAQVVKFVYSHMVNAFKGAVRKLLAAGACQRLIDAWMSGKESRHCRLIVLSIEELRPHRFS